jgi:ubiquinone/menaquinone biosynthesis C-methylase UbiE
MTNKYFDIYQEMADKYHQMMLVEDVDGNLTAALRSIASFEGKRVLDLGTGTGRIPLLFGEQAAIMVGLDLHWGMLRENCMQRDAQGGGWSLVHGDMRYLPVTENNFDIVTAGWAIGHFGSWYPDNWREEITKVVQGIHKVCKIGGTVIIMETLSTGSTTPAPPKQMLADYYAILEEEWGFEGRQVQTDYLFKSVDQAVAMTEFFFGEQLSEKIRKNEWARLPEWTGIWSKQIQ